ncbi:hypothetical protein AQUCO_03800014v1 [Aquilegia coerulea]|uniref:Protein DETOXIFICATION n=1 Tax=Aquilegia coerulea TaxID=218851 RepID=A0A2G5CS78_AQUCA|nr:hypothetical protein AQUCO_03800014v1 [Aquilegia coerulea]
MSGDFSAPLLRKNNGKDISGEEEEDISLKSSFVRKTWEEVKTTWYIAGPAILTSLFQYSLGFVTRTLVGHLGTIELAAVGLQGLVVSGIGFGIMMGMGSALETLCGQAYGAGKPSMLGIYMQRSWVILLMTAIPLTLVYIFAEPILKLLGQSSEIAEVAGKFSIWMLPQLLAYALNFPLQKFLQAQSKVMAMAWISLGVLVLHVGLSWLSIVKLEMGLVGAAISLNLSWCLMVICQMIYVFTCCKEAWTGFSWLAFTDLIGFIGLSLASAVMLCLEYWCYMVLIVLAGLLKNPEIQVDAASICMSVEGWLFMIPLGFIAASSVRVSNELGAGRPKAAKFSVAVMVSMSLVIESTFVVLILTTRKVFPALFTNNKLVMAEASDLAIFLSLSIILCSVQPVLSGVAIGAGWQSKVAYVNIATYYLVGLPIGVLLGFKLPFGLQGIWSGVILGIALQTIILVIMTLRTDWEKEAALAKLRVSSWGTSTDKLSNGCS